jgi:vacuolar-type H+-ATPase subunit H
MMPTTGRWDRPDGGEDIMGLDDIVNKAKEAAEDIADKAKDAGIDLREKADEALHSDQAEKISDAVLDAGEKAANTVTGGKFEEKVGDVRDDLDAKVGNDGKAAPAAS